MFNKENMRILHLTQKGFALGGLDEAQHRLNKRTLLIFSIFGLCITSQCIFTIRIAKNFIEYIDCICKTGTVFAIAVCYASLVFRKSQLFAFVNEMQELCDKSKQSLEKKLLYWTLLNAFSIIFLGLRISGSKSLYEELNRKIEKWSAIIYFVSVIIFPINLIGSMIILSFYTYFTTDLDSDAFALPVPMWFVINRKVPRKSYVEDFNCHFLNSIERFPFNWKNPTGYLSAALVQYLLATFVFFIISCSATLAFAIYLFTETAANDIVHNLHTFNKNAESKKNQHLLLARTQLIELIDYHANLKQLSQIDDFFKEKYSIKLYVFSCRSITGIAKVFQPKCLILMLFSIVFLCGTMLTIQTVITHSVLEKKRETISFCHRSVSVLPHRVWLTQVRSRAFRQLIDEKRTKWPIKLLLQNIIWIQLSSDSYKLLGIKRPILKKNRRSTYNTKHHTSFPFSYFIINF